MRHPFLRTLAGSAAPAATDPNFENVTLLLHGDGTNGGQNNTFVDGSTNNFTITRNGNTTQGTFSPYGDNWSNYFDGTGDFLSLTGQSLASGDWTIECWVYFQSFTNAGPHIFDFGTDSNNRYVLWRNDSSGKFEFVTVNSGTYDFKAGTTSPVVGTWYHVAVVRSSGTTKLYVNGTSEATSTTAINGGTTWRIGYPIGATANTYYIFGYISNFRVVTSAVYTANFTPTTAPLTAIANTSLLTCSTNRFRDVSSNNRTITRNGDVSVQRFSPFNPTAAYAAGTIGGSGYFDGTGDYLVTPTNAALSVGTGDFTCETFVYFNALEANNHGIVSQLTTGDGSNHSIVFFTAGSTVYLRIQSLLGVVFEGSTTASVGQWYHLALVRSGTNIAAFINGSRVNSGTNSTNVVKQLFTIGRLYNNVEQELSKVYVSNFRLVKGSAVYDPTQTTLTVPTAPLTAITNTSLLLNFTNAAIIDNAMMSVPETVGNAQISTSVKKYGTGSLYFDGTDDGLTSPYNPAYSFGTGEFTIEAWVYIAGNSAVDAGGVRAAVVVCSFVTSGAITNSWALAISGNATTTGTGFFFQHFVSGTSYTVSVTTTLSQTTWHHLAVARSGTITKLFLNGSEVASGTLGNQNVNGAYPIYVGRNIYTGYPNVLNGYIDDLRVTKGVARYTSNFTAPTAAFPDL